MFDTTSKEQPARSTTAVRESRGPASGSNGRNGEVHQSACATQSRDHVVSDSHEVHTQLKMLRACGNEIRLAFLDGLRTLYDRSLCFELGYLSYHQYCDRELGLSRSTAYEYLRAALALDGLPQLRRLFREGELSWTQVRAITRVAEADTEDRWIEFAWADTVRELLAEVREAQRTGQVAPRRSRRGLPNLVVDLGVKVTLEEKARIRAAFLLVTEALAGSDVGGEAEEFNRRPPLVRWADAVLAGVIPAGPNVVATDAAAREFTGADSVGDHGEGSTLGAVGKSDVRHTNPGPAPVTAPAQTIVYHVCTECRHSAVVTDDGRVSVSPARIDELAPQANRVEIPVDDDPCFEMLPPGEVDAPNTARLRRQVLHRDGLVCANPGCGRRHDLQAHHIVYRANGGRTILSNEVAVCSTCHAMIHEGLLEVSGCVDSGLSWMPRPLDSRVKIRDAAALRERARGLVEQLGSTESRSCHAAEAPFADESTWETGSGSRRPDRSALSGARTESTPATRHGADVGSPADPFRGHTNGESTPETGALAPAGLAMVGFPRRRDPSTREDVIGARHVRDLSYGLKHLGLALAEGEERVGEAIVELVQEARAGQGKDAPPFRPTDEEIMLRALRGTAPTA